MSNKFGSERRCPQCNAVIPASATKCEYCGFEFTDIEANQSSQKLSELLLSDLSSEDKCAAITAFPIPNTKEDLLEFITALSTRCSDKNYGDAYKSKLDECVKKARLLFPNDAQLNKVISDMENKKKRTILFASIGGTLLVVLIIVICVVVKNSSRNHDHDACQAAIELAIRGNHPEKGLKYYRNYVGEDPLDLSYVQDIAWLFVKDNKIKSALNMYQIYGDQVCAPIVWYYAQQLDLDNARKYLVLSSEVSEQGNNYENRMNKKYYYCDLYVNFLGMVVNTYCSKGDLASAEQFADEETNRLFKGRDNYFYEGRYLDRQSTIIAVKEQLTGIVNNYK